MDNEFQEKLKSVLSDPEALSKISAIASSLGMAKPQENGENAVSAGEFESVPTPKEEKHEEANLQNVFDLLPSQNVSDPRLLLLSSLKPLLREEKREKIDKLTRALTVASMMKMFRK